MTLEPDTEITDPETPIATTEPPETPPDAVVTDEQPDGEETPAQPDSKLEVADAAPADESAGKTPEQVKDDAAHWQSEYQKSQDELKALMGDEGGDDAPEPEPQLPAQPAAPDRSMTDEEATEMLQDPRIQMQIQRAWMREDVRTEIADANVKERHRTESVEANRVLQKFRHDQGIGDEDFKTAETAVKGSGLKGSPAAINSAIIRELNYQQMLGHLNTKTKQTEANTAAKVKRQLLTTQPAAGAQQLKEVDPAKALADAIAPTTTD